MPVYLPPISRRRFLAGMVAAGASLAKPCVGLATKTQSEPSEKWLLMSDMHVGSKADHDPRTRQTASRFSDAVAKILQGQYGCQKAIVTGDCAALQGAPEDYAHFLDLIAPLRSAKIGFHLTIGNHDHRNNFLSALRGVRDSGNSESYVFHKYAYVLETKMANWFFLDSLESARVGRLGDAQLKWLDKSLVAHGNKPALIVAHHDPSTHSEHALHDTAKLYDLIGSRKQVKAYIFGHTHCWNVGEYKGIHLVNVPTISSWKDDKEPWAYLTAHVNADGMSLMLHCTHHHPQHHQTRNLTWRS
jgi:3',5'-cyclic-AMP phosphodiesterase